MPVLSPTEWCASRGVFTYYTNYSPSGDPLSLPPSLPPSLSPQLDNLTLMELNCVRPFLTSALDQLHLLHSHAASYTPSQTD